MTRRLTCTLALWLCAASAAAQPHPPRGAPAPDPAVEAEHQRGIELRRQQRDGEAREVFRALYERTHEPRALARQAAAEAAMGDWLGAEAHLTEALARAEDPWIAQQRAGLEADLASFREHVGLLEVDTMTPRASVWIGGERVAELPLTRPIRTRAGTLAVELRAEGYITESRTVTVPGGLRAPAREVFQLTATPRDLPPAPVLRPATPPSPPSPPSVWPLRIAGFGVLAAGVAGLGVGIAGFALREDTVSRFNANPACGTNALTSDCTTLFDEGNGQFVMGVVGLAAGGVLVLGGVTMTALASRRPLPLAVAAGPRGVTLSGSF